MRGWCIPRGLARVTRRIDTRVTCAGRLQLTPAW